MDRSEQALLLKLHNSRERPIFTHTVNNEDITMLFDSGALAPVWCMGKNKLLRAYPEAVNKNEKCLISGFGKEAIEGEAYTLPLFQLTDQGVSYKIKNLQVAVCKAPGIVCDFVLSDTMFSKADTMIRRRKGKALEILFDKEEYCCTPKYNNDRTKFSVAVWAQEE